MASNLSSTNLAIEISRAETLHMTYLEHPISLASHWCWTNSCREANLLGGEAEYWGLMVEAMALLM